VMQEHMGKRMAVEAYGDERRRTTAGGVSGRAVAMGVPWVS
jgi:hypothetical protein